MEIADLNRFLVIARYENLQRAADELDTTPSALSKSLKRLESSFELQLFDRVGKTLRLNEQGRQLQPKAAQMVTLAEDTRRQLCPASQTIECKIAAPAILQYKWASVLSRIRPSNTDISLTFETAFEANALERLRLGEVHLALVTDAIMTDIPDSISALPLGELSMHMAAGLNHALAKQKRVAQKDIQNHAFATPHISPFCGETRGLGCDGWRDQLVPRKVSWVVNDYAVLSQLVKSGQAIAYLPDFLIREWQLKQLTVEDYPHQYKEKVLLLHHKRTADWVIELVTQLVD